MFYIICTSIHKKLGLDTLNFKWLGSSSNFHTNHLYLISIILDIYNYYDVRTINKYSDEIGLWKFFMGSKNKQYGSHDIAFHIFSIDINSLSAETLDSFMFMFKQFDANYDMTNGSKSKIVTFGKP